MTLSWTEFKAHNTEQHAESSSRLDLKQTGAAATPQLSMLGRRAADQTRLPSVRPLTTRRDRSPSEIQKSPLKRRFTATVEFMEPERLKSDLPSILSTNISPTNHEQLQQAAFDRANKHIQVNRIPLNHNPQQYIQGLSAGYYQETQSTRRAQLRGPNRIHREVVDQYQPRYGNLEVDQDRIARNMLTDSETSPNGVVCSDCDKVYTGEYRKGNLARHRRQKHDTAEQEYFCLEPHCRQKFKRKDSLEKHMRRSHASERIESRRKDTEPWRNPRREFDALSGPNTVSIPSSLKQKDKISAKYASSYLNMHYTISRDTTRNDKQERQQRLAQLCRQKHVLRQELLIENSEEVRSGSLYSGEPDADGLYPPPQRGGVRIHEPVKSRYYRYSEAAREEPFAREIRTWSPLEAIPSESR